MRFAAVSSTCKGATRGHHAGATYCTLTQRAVPYPAIHFRCSRPPWSCGAAGYGSSAESTSSTFDGSIAATGEAEQAAPGSNLLETNSQPQEQQLESCAYGQACPQLRNSDEDDASSNHISNNSSITSSSHGSSEDSISIDLLHAEHDGRSSNSDKLSSGSSSSSTRRSVSSDSGDVDQTTCPNEAEAAATLSEAEAAVSSVAAAAEQGAAEPAFSYSSFSSIDDEVSAVEVAVAKQAAREKEAAAAAAAVAAAAAAAADKPWWPPTEFAALLGLAVAFVIAGISNALLCKPVQLNYSHQRIVRQCSSCCGSPAVQAAHNQYIIRQPQLPLPALPLPLRQQLDLDALPPPSYRVPLLVSLPSAADDGITASLVAAKDWVHGRVAYHLQQLATANISTKVVVLSLFATPFILLFGYMYHKAAHVKFGAAMYKVYALLYRVPGVGIAKEDNVYAYIVANMAFLAGLFTFAGILGIVSDEIKMGIKNSRSGNYNMRLSGHILILNWNGNTTSLLRQIASAYAEGGMFDNGRWLLTNRPPVVVLADKKKAQMDEAVHEMLRDRGLHLEVHTREGNPFKLSELKRVAASKAGTIIVLHPDSASSAQNAEAIKASVAMCITALGPQSNQRVVVQATGSPSEAGLLSSLSVASQLGGKAAIQSMELPDHQLMLQLVTQSAAQPGILTCWLDILALANNSAQFYVAELPAGLEGKPYMDVRRAFAHAVLCGYRLPDGDAVMNPGEADVPPAGAQLIFLGRGGAGHLIASPGDPVYESAAKSAAERMKRERTYRSKARNILVSNWSAEGIPELMEGFAQFTPANSIVTFAMQGEPHPDWPPRINNCRFNFVAAKQPSSVKVLLEAGIKAADAVVLGSGSSAGGDLESDARVLAAILQVQDAVLASKRKDTPHLVAPIKRYATSKLAAQWLETLAAEQAAGAPAAALQPSAAAKPGTTAAAAPASKSGGFFGLVPQALLGQGSPSSQQQQLQQQQLAVIDSCEFLVPGDVMSALMTQVVADPAYAGIMKALLGSREGQEMYLRNPASFNLPTGVPLCFAEVEEAVRLTRQTALGYIRGRHSKSGNCSLAKNKQAGAGQRKVVLGPAASHTLVFEEHDRIVVLAPDFSAAGAASSNGQ